MRATASRPRDRKPSAPARTARRTGRWSGRPYTAAVLADFVQRGLGSRAYEAGRLSVRREAGEHLFHRLLAADLRAEARRREHGPG